MNLEQRLVRHRTNREHAFRLQRTEPASLAAGDNQRDALWAHPDLIPTDADIDDPSALIARLTSDTRIPDDVDMAIEDLLNDDGDRPHEV